MLTPQEGMSTQDPSSLTWTLSMPSPNWWYVATGGSHGSASRYRTWSFSELIHSLVLGQPDFGDGNQASQELGFPPAILVSQQPTQIEQFLITGHTGPLRM